MPQARARFADNPGMITFISFVIVAILNYILIRLANSWFPFQIVMGTVDMTAHWAGVLFGSALSLLTVFFLPFLTMWEHRRGKGLSPNEMMAVYLVFNFVSIWLLTRKSEIFGVGVTSWVVVLMLAIVFDVVQGLVMMQIEKWRLNK